MIYISGMKSIKTLMLGDRNMNMLWSEKLLWLSGLGVVIAICFLLYILTNIVFGL